MNKVIVETPYIVTAQPLDEYKINKFVWKDLIFDYFVSKVCTHKKIFNICSPPAIDPLSSIQINPFQIVGWKWSHDLKYHDHHDLKWPMQAEESINLNS